MSSGSQIRLMWTTVKRRQPIRLKIRHALKTSQLRVVLLVDANALLCRSRSALHCRSYSTSVML